MRILYLIPLLLISLILVTCKGLEKNNKELKLIVKHYKQGPLESIGYLNDSLKQGLWKYFDYTGYKLREVEYKDNLIDGKHTEYRLGKKSAEYTYENGILHGPTIIYNYKTGLVDEYGEYLNGNLEGLYYTYYCGLIEDVLLYKNNKILDTLYSNNYLKSIKTCPFPESNECCDSLRKELK